ncbi:uncharacterized protein [Panulirus ornatus]|uniref:uncharacterized protein n=1 Tax=Panulirus ornatus TaxID=150431 RepID=UPI003A8A669C
MAARSLEEDVRRECKLRLSSLDEGQHGPEGELTLGRVVAPDPGGPGGVREVGVEALLSTPRVDGTAARAWVLSGESGRGKSSVARCLARAWSRGTSSVQEIHNFQGVVVVSGYTVASDDCWEAVKTLLPDTLARWGPSQVAEWMEEARVLVIVDDFVLKNAGKEVEDALEEWKEASFMILTTPSDAAGTVAILAARRPTLSLTMPGLERCDVITMAAQYLPGQALEGLSSWLVGNWSTAGEVLSYPGLVQPACHAWRLGHITDATVTTTQLMWHLVEARVAQESRVGAAILPEWLLVLGRLTRRSLETRKLPQKEEMETEARRLFPAGVAEDIVVNLLPISASAASTSTLSFPHPLTQFLAGWDALHQNLRGTPLKSLVKRLEDEDSVVLYVAGHLARLLQHQPQYPDKQVERVAKNLVLHMDRAADRFGYTLRVIHEFRLHPRALNLLQNEVEFPRLWEVYDAAILLEPLAALLQQDTPDKIIVSVEKNRLAPDLEGVVSLITSKKIPMFLAEMNHLEWDNPDTTDNLVRMVQRGTSQLQDFMGCLTTPTITSLTTAVTTRNLVCLRVRVKDQESVQAILRCPSDLTSLMWLEVDFDLLLHDLDKSQVPQVTTPLMDVSFKDLRDEDVPFLCEFLAHIRRRYSGVHLMRSVLSPQGVTEVLKQFFKRGMLMTADPALINRYRRWRFPVLATTISTTEELTDEVVSHLLGYDDRYHYSDNEARSSVLSTRVDARALANFFTAIKDLLHFRYVCANYSVVKNTDGSIEMKDLV